jgi:hypothetical protein
LSLSLCLDLFEDVWPTNLSPWVGELRLTGNL